MTPSQIKWLATYADIVAVRDRLNLSPRQKEVFNLRYLHDNTLVKIADTLGCSLSTIAHESSVINSKLRRIDAKLTLIEHN